MSEELSQRSLLALEQVDEIERQRRETFRRNGLAPRTFQGVNADTGAVIMGSPGGGQAQAIEQGNLSNAAIQTGRAIRSYNSQTVDWQLTESQLPEDITPRDDPTSYDDQEQDNNPDDVPDNTPPLDDAGDYCECQTAWIRVGEQPELSAEFTISINGKESGGPPFPGGQCEGSFYTITGTDTVTVEATGDTFINTINTSGYGPIGLATIIATNPFNGDVAIRKVFTGRILSPSDPITNLGGAPSFLITERDINGDLKLSGSADYTINTSDPDDCGDPDPELDECIFENFTRTITWDNPGPGPYSILLGNPTVAGSCPELNLFSGVSVQASDGSTSESVSAFVLSASIQSVEFTTEDLPPDAGEWKSVTSCDPPVGASQSVVDGNRIVTVTDSTGIISELNLGESSVSLLTVRCSEEGPP